MQLLVSVVRADEVGPAVAGGADIVDVKNPREGSLGANFPHVIRCIRQMTPMNIPVSAAIGDVPNLPGTIALAALGAASCAVQYVKVGLYGTSAPADAIALLSEVCRAVRSVAPDAKVIATAYADASAVGALPPLTLPTVASESGVDGCMLDTAVKGGGTLLTCLNVEQLCGFGQHCRDAGLLWALAGSLGEGDVPQLCELHPDIIGIRSAACIGDRTNGRVDQQKVAAFKSLLRRSESQ